MSIFGSLERYSNIRLHTPGHKGNMPYGLGKLDLTEIDDGFYFPNELITNAQVNTAQIYNAKHCRYLVNGSSTGIKAAIMSLDCDILIFDNSHKSIYDGIRLARVKAYEYALCKSKIPLAPTIDTLKLAFEKYPSVKAVVITSPDYFGQTVDRIVIDFIKSSGRIVVNDSAHGAHFVFCDELRQKSLVDMCDISIVSAHKTLNTLTQASIAFVNNESLLEKLDSNLSLLGTTSPSYLLLGSIEYGVNYAKDNCCKYAELKDKIIKITKNIKTIQSSDFTRVVIDCCYYRLSGKQVYDKLFVKGISAEMYTDNLLVLIFTINDNAKTIAKVGNVLEEILLN